MKFDKNKRTTVAPRSGPKPSVGRLSESELDDVVARLTGDQDVTVREAESPLDSSTELVESEGALSESIIEQLRK